MKFPSGIIEGFYGHPWSQRDRLSMVQFLAENHLNTYIYAPHDDRYHRAEWRKPYPEAEAKKMRELVRASGDSGVNFIFSVNPGLNVTYSSRQDLKLLCGKLQTAIDWGCTSVGILFDDVPAKLERQRDRGFSTLAQAHAYLVNSAYDEIQKSGQIWTLFGAVYYANKYYGEKSQDQYIPRRDWKRDLPEDRLLVDG